MTVQKDTLERVIIDLVIYGLGDRAALVRPSQVGKSPAVCVIMEGDAALRELGKPLLEIARGLGNGPADFGVPEISVQIGLSPLFDIVDAAPNGWCWAGFRYVHLNLTLAMFCREVERVAAVCTANRAPCSLDSAKPAEGWEIERTLQRT